MLCVRALLHVVLAVATALAVYMVAYSPATRTPTAAAAAADPPTPFTRIVSSLSLGWMARDGGHQDDRAAAAPLDSYASQFASYLQGSTLLYTAWSSEAANSSTTRCHDGPARCGSNLFDRIVAWMQGAQGLLLTNATRAVEGSTLVDTTAATATTAAATASEEDTGFVSSCGRPALNQLSALLDSVQTLLTCAVPHSAEQMLDVIALFATTTFNTMLDMTAPKSAPQINVFASSSAAAAASAHPDDDALSTLFWIVSAILVWLALLAVNGALLLTIPVASPAPTPQPHAAERTTPAPSPEESIARACPVSETAAAPPSDPASAKDQGSPKEPASPVAVDKSPDHDDALPRSSNASKAAPHTPRCPAPADVPKSKKLAAAGMATPASLEGTINPAMQTASPTAISPSSLPNPLIASKVKAPKRAGKSNLTPKPSQASKAASTGKVPSPKALLGMRGPLRSNGSLPVPPLQHNGHRGARSMSSESPLPRTKPSAHVPERLPSIRYTPVDSYRFQAILGDLDSIANKLLRFGDKAHTSDEVQEACYDALASIKQRIGRYAGACPKAQPMLDLLRAMEQLLGLLDPAIVWAGNTSTKHTMAAPIGNLCHRLRMLRAVLQPRQAADDRHSDSELDIVKRKHLQGTSSRKIAPPLFEASLATLGDQENAVPSPHCTPSTPRADRAILAATNSPPMDSSKRESAAVDRQASSSAARTVASTRVEKFDETAKLLRILSFVSYDDDEDVAYEPSAHDFSAVARSNGYWGAPSRLVADPAPTRKSPQNKSACIPEKPSFDASACASAATGAISKQEWTAMVAQHAPVAPVKPRVILEAKSARTRARSAVPPLFAFGSNVQWPTAASNAVTAPAIDAPLVPCPVPDAPLFRFDMGMPIPPLTRAAAPAVQSALNPKHARRKRIAKPAK